MQEKTACANRFAGLAENGITKAYMLRNNGRNQTTKTMKRIIIFLLLAASAVAIEAQTVNGRVVDGSGQPVAYATVSLLSVVDSAFISGTTTGDDGTFAISAAATEGILRITCIGYTTLTCRISSPDAGTLTLLQESHELQGVEVSVQKRLVKQEMDRIAYDVQADEESKTVTVFDLLRKVPLVSVDGEDNIAVKGQRSFRVYKNGHYSPSLSTNTSQMLKAMPASSVKSIEVITEPGAREDAEGVNAILNIVMVEARQLGGLTGTVGAHTTTARGHGATANLTAQKGRFTTSINYMWRYMDGRSTENWGDESQHYTNTANTLYSTRWGNNPGSINSADIDASYEIDSLNLLTLSFGGYFYKLDVRGNGSQSMEDADGNVLYSMNNRYKSDDYLVHSWNGRFDYEHRTHLKNEVLTFSYMISLTRNRNTQLHQLEELVSPPFGYDNYTTGLKENFAEHTFQIDYVRPLGKYHKVEVGTKYIYRDNNSRNQQHYFLGTTPLEALSEVGNMHFAHSTHVGAGYVDYLYSRNKWAARAGVRYEWSRLAGRYPSGSGESYHTNLHDWVPQLSVKYQISDAQSVKAAFNTSISRPGIGYLNPAVSITPNRMSFGNAALKSARAYSVSLNYMLIKPRLTLTANPYYAWSSHQIIPVAYTEGNVRVGTYANAGNNRRLAMTVYA